MKKKNNKWQLLVLLLKEVAAEKGITQEMIAKDTGLLQSNISRIFALKYRPTLDTFMKIIDALDLQVGLKDKDELFDMNACLNRATDNLNNS